MMCSILYYNPSLRQVIFNNITVLNSSNGQFSCLGCLWFTTLNRFQTQNLFQNFMKEIKNTHHGAAKTPSAHLMELSFFLMNKATMYTHPENCDSLSFGSIPCCKTKVKSLSFPARALLNITLFGSLSSSLTIDVVL